MAGDDLQCGICRRNLLTGERPFRFVDPKAGPVLVCALCEERAERGGWAREEDPPPITVEAGDADRTVRLLQAEVTTLRTRLTMAMDTLEDTREHTAERESELDTLAARLADAEAEGAALRAALAEEERRHAQLAHDLEESRTAQAAILRARRREADDVYLAGIAAEVFNRSPQAATIGLLVGLHGTPDVRLEVAGAVLPRPVLIAFSWPQGGRDYRVDIDLVARRFDLHDLVPGGDGRLVPRAAPLEPNAEWLDGRIVAQAAEPTIQ
ncbi:MAG: hypothetical protein ACO3KD_09005 [Gaiellales bacterium]